MQESQMFLITLAPDADEVVQPHLEPNFQRGRPIEGQRCQTRRRSRLRSCGGINRLCFHRQCALTCCSDPAGTMPRDWPLKSRAKERILTEILFGEGGGQESHVPCCSVSVGRIPLLSWVGLRVAGHVANGSALGPANASE